MFLLRRPSAARIERFLTQCRDLPLSYGSVGMVRGTSSSGRFDEAITAIGRGQRDFERARAALLAWKQFDVGWVEVFPQHAPVQIGTVVAVLIRHLGIWSLNGARVVYLVEDHEGASSGFAYGTLTNHAESGEELFEVFLDAQNDLVCYRIRAISWPQSLLARIGQPVVRLLQARFRRDSATAMKRALNPGC